MNSKTLATTILTVGALASTALGLAGPAAAAPTAPGSAQDTVNQLEAEGYRVIVNKLGSGALSECTVTAVRPGQDVTHRVTLPGTDGTVEQLRYTTVYVDAKC